VSENLELVRSIYAGWERGDYSATDWVDPEIQFVIADGPAPGTWTGLDGMREAMHGLLSGFDVMGAIADEYREIGTDLILVLAHPVGHGKTSGLNLEQTGAKGAQLFYFRDRKVTRFVHYFDSDGALADLGLKE
jgi:ketosteroid isomerase-like protein